MSQVISIGGVGGSGTRLIQQLLSGDLRYWGGCLNSARDNLLFTVLFKLQAVIDSTEVVQDHYFLFKQYMQYGYLAEKQKAFILDVAARHAQGKYILKAIDCINAIPDRPLEESRIWGWKEPNTHLIIDKLCAIEPELKYIHVMRHGLDMAYSSNHNQARNWGAQIVGKPFDSSPQYLLEYWVKSHQRVVEFKQAYPRNIHIVNFDKLCLLDIDEIKKLFSFAEIESPAMNGIFDMIIKPDGMGRYKKYALDGFPEEDLAFVERLGFTI